MSKADELCAQPGREPNLWFSARGSDEARLAKQLCMACPLYFQCQSYALTEGIPEGIWGGMDERERRDYWKRNGGKPTKFLDDIDAAIGVFTNTFREGEAA